MPTARAILDALYPLPDPLSSLEQAWRAQHADVADLSPAERARERRRVLWRLDYEPDLERRAWLQGRAAALARSGPEARS